LKGAAMSDASAFNFGKFIPGFDFLQQLAASRPGAGVAAPGLGGWVAPTVSVEELDRRIQELKAVQFWLDQNAAAIKATIQALEVQKMTLATLQSMNLGMAEVAKVFTLPTGDAAPAQPAASAAPPAQATEEPAPLAKPAPRARSARKPAVPKKPRPTAGGPADPMQWWNALTQQFQHIAANTLREAGSAAPVQAATNSEAAGADQTGARGQKDVKKSLRGKQPAPKGAGAAPKKSQTGG
jgi:hypothetical protein